MIAYQLITQTKTIRSASLQILTSIITLVLLCSYQPAEERLLEKAEKIHREVLVLDSHVDTPLMLFRDEFDIGQYNDARNRGGKLDFPRMEEGGLDAAFFAVYVGQGALNPEAYKAAKNRALNVFDRIHQAIEEHPDVAGLALTPDDAYRLQAKNKRAIYLGVENGYPLGYDLSILRKFYDLGGRYLGLSHSGNNQICDSSTDPEGEKHGGLSEFGKEVVRKLNKLGMMVDVSHISDKAFYDVLEITQTPVIASHSNVRALCNHPRNLNDDMIRALAQNGGVIQLCVLSGYVKNMGPDPQRDSAIADLRARYNNFTGIGEEEMDNARREWDAIDERFPRKLATVSDFVDHIDHVVKLVGVDYVGIGTDFDGGGALSDCYDVAELGNITLELVRRGYTKKEIEKIWSGNFMRVFRTVVAAADQSSHH